MKARAFFLALFAFVALAFPAQAQIGGGVQQHGQVAQGSTDCAQWAGPGQISDSGSGCGGGGSGTVTSISAGCGSSTGGSAITTTGTIAAVEPVDRETGTNFPIPNSDCGYLVNLSNDSAQTPTIAAAGAGGNFTAGWYADVCNIGAGTQTLTPATSTIGGNASLAINTGQCVRVVSDGTNYQLAQTPNAASLTQADQLLSGGANVTSFSNGTKSSGTFTIDCGKGPLQYATNGGAFTLAAPANDGSCIILITNNGSAGTITPSGFTEGSNTGDTPDTTSTHAFAWAITRINSVAHYLVSAYQ